MRHGVPVPVGYRALRLLVAFLDKPGKVLTKSDLIDAAWEGAAVEEGNLSVQIASLRKLLGQLPDGNDWITTIPRVGYRFGGPIARRGEEAGDNGKASDELGNGPSIAVLPFINLSDDREQEYFADGITEDIITRLARLRWLFVAARNSSFAYKGQKVEPGQVGRDLRVRYILEGSVRRSGNRLRINSQLSETSSGIQVWADSNEVELAEFFALQDMISERVIAAIEPRLYAAEHERFKTRPPESLDAWGFVMKAMPYVWTWGSADEISRAQELLAKAIAIDPSYSRANGLMGWTIAARAHLGLADALDNLPKATALALQAIQNDPQDPWSYFAAGYVHMIARKFDAAIAAYGEAIALNPSLAIAHLMMGSTYAYGGFPADGLHYLALAERMSSRDFSQAAIYSTSGLCHFMAGRYDQAIASQRRALELRPHFGTAWRTLAASAGLAGDLDTGRHALAECLRLQPSLSLDWVEKYHPIVRKSDREKYLDGLRSVGLN
ncbi:MAG: winged helix-turn-helix domain-containing protein [Aestuariivirga sp.]